MKALLQPEKLFRLALWMIALLFAWFLLGFGNLILRDLPLTSKELPPDQFKTPQLLILEQNKKRIETEQNSLRDQHDLYQQTLDTQQNQYDNEHANFQNWLATRTATQQATQNAELIQRTQKLEAIKTTQAATQQKLADLAQQLLRLNQQQAQLNPQFDALQQQSNQRYEQAVFKQELTIFAYRLLFILPLILAAIWLFVRKRQSKYWPFVWGFIFFTLYSFFVELVPYLPSYGGYVRYAVGLILVLVGGAYGIRWMNHYLTQRQLKSQAVETERRRQLDHIMAIKKLTANVCPSCERQLVGSNDVQNNFCMFCGLKLYRSCPSCHTRHNTFFGYCPCCGTTNQDLAGNAP